VRLGATTQNILTFLKMIAITVLIVGAFVLPGGNGANFRPLWPSAPLGQVIGPFGLAMMSVLWAYDGWIETTFVGSEIKNPGRNLPRAIILSTLIVIAFYVSVSVAFSYVLTPLRMGASSLVASDAAQVTMGTAGAAIVAAAIMLSTLGANNGIILTAARIPYAMARQGLFFRSQGWVHPRFATPAVALLTQGVISILLALAGNYNQLATYVVFAQVLFYGLSATAVVKLRHSAPGLPRPVPHCQPGPDTTSRSASGSFSPLEAQPAEDSLRNGADDQHDRPPETRKIDHRRAAVDSPGDARRDLGDFHRVGQPGTQVVIFGSDEHLALPGQSAPRTGVLDPVEVALKAKPVGIGVLGMEPLPCSDRPGGARSQSFRQLELPFLAGQQRPADPCGGVGVDHCELIGQLDSRSDSVGPRARGTHDTD